SRGSSTRSLRIGRADRTQKGMDCSFTPTESDREKPEAAESVLRPTRAHCRSSVETEADPAVPDCEPGAPDGHCFVPACSADVQSASESDSRAWPPSCRRSCVHTDSPAASPPEYLPRSPNDTVPLSCNAHARCLGSAVRWKSRRGAPPSPPPRANSLRSLPSFLQSGRTVARSGLRMMPTFPPSPLSVGSRTDAKLRRFDLSVAPRFLWECLTNRIVSWFSAPATSNRACPFRALGFPA